MEKVAEAWSLEMRRGHTKLVILTLLSKVNLTGYAIMKEFSEKTLGLWRLTSGGVYPILRELEEKGYITGVWDARGSRKRKIYEITEEGKQLLKAALQKQQQIAKTMNGLIREYALDVLETETPSGLMDKVMNFFSLEKNLKEKTIEEQVRILNRFRSHVLKILKNIDERLENLQAKKWQVNGGDSLNTIR